MAFLSSISESQTRVCPPPILCFHSDQCFSLSLCCLEVTLKALEKQPDAPLLTWYNGLNTEVESHCSLQAVILFFLVFTWIPFPQLWKWHWGCFFCGFLYHFVPRDNCAMVLQKYGNFTQIKQCWLKTSYSSPGVFLLCKMLVHRPFPLIKALDNLGPGERLFLQPKKGYHQNKLLLTSGLVMTD